MIPSWLIILIGLSLVFYLLARGLESIFNSANIVRYWEDDSGEDDDDDDDDDDPAPWWKR